MIIILLHMSRIVANLTYFPRLELDHHDGLIQASDLHLACVPALILVVRAVGIQGLPVKN
jgi:hypothetical protein